MKQSKRTVVIGASPDAGRYSFLAVRRLKEAGHEVVAVGRREGAINGVKIQTGFPEVSGVNTVSLYVSPRHQAEYTDYILNILKPQRIIFNPGTENHEFEARAARQDIEVLDACTLVMLSAGTY